MRRFIIWALSLLGILVVGVGFLYLVAFHYVVWGYWFSRHAKPAEDDEDAPPAKPADSDE